MHLCVRALVCVCVHTKWNISTPMVAKMPKKINMIINACDSGPSEASSELMSKRSFSKRPKTRKTRSVLKTRICFTPGTSSGRISSITHKKMMKVSKRYHPSPQKSQNQYAVMLSASSSMKITNSTCQKITSRRLVFVHTMTFDTDFVENVCLVDDVEVLQSCRL